MSLLKMVLPDRSKSANTTANRENPHNERKVNISVGRLQAARALQIWVSSAVLSGNICVLFESDN